MESPCFQTSTVPESSSLFTSNRFYVAFLASFYCAKNPSTKKDKVLHHEIQLISIVAESTFPSVNDDVHFIR